MAPPEDDVVGMLLHFGRLFPLVPETNGMPVVPPVESTLLLGDGPLSTGLDSALAQPLSAASQFTEEVDGGLAETGRGLETLARDVEEIDREGAKAIKNVFPEPAPGSSGEQ